MKWLGLAMWMIAGVAMGQQTATQWVDLNPSVARPGQTVTLRACVRGQAATRVTLEPVVAGQFVTQELVSEGGCLWRGQFRAPNAGVDDMFRPDFGLLRVYAGTNLLETINVFPEIFTDELPLLPVVQLGPGVQRTNYVVNVVEPRVFPANGAALFQPDLAAATSKFYQYLPDDFDQLNIVLGRGYPMNRFHRPVRQLVSGVGFRQTIFDTDAFGSAARLQGVNVFPISAAFDGAERTQSHEFAHQWINYITEGPLGAGGAHWPISSIASGVMGSGSTTDAGIGGAFGCALRLENGQLVSSVAPALKVFNPLDLYLMGLIPAEEVPDQYVVTDAAAANALARSCAQPPLNASQFQTVRIADLVRQLGPRVPSAAVSQKQYRIATIVVSDRLLNQEEMSFYSHFARRAEEKVAVWTKLGFGKVRSNPMWVATGGRLSLDTRIVRDPVAEIAGNGVVNGAFSVPEGMAPGGLTSIFGSGLGTSQTSAASLPLPTELGGTRVFVNGQRAPLFFSSTGQVNFVVPMNVTPSALGLASVRVESALGASNLAYFNLKTNAPAVLNYGDQRAIVVDTQNRLITADNPARPTQVLVMYLTGIGQTTPPVVAGEASPQSPLAQCVLRPQIRMTGALTGVEFCGLTPGLTGLAQINFRIPPGVPEGDVAVEVLWGATVSNKVMLRVTR